MSSHRLVRSIKELDRPATRVRDKATIDQLVARGESGSRRLEARIQQLLSTPETTRAKWYVESWRVEVVSIPAPPTGLIHRDILTAAGYNTAGEPFPDKGSGKPHPVRLLEDGVLLEMGAHDLARFTDGSVLVRFRPHEIPYVVARWVAETLLLPIEGQASFSPPVPQVLVWVRLGGVLGLPIAWNVQQFRSDEEFKSQKWGPLTHLVATTGDEAKGFAEEVARRLMRALGLRAFEE
jgi:hypothetical protein